MNSQVSISPDGVKYPLPKDEDYRAEFDRIKKLVGKAQKGGAGDRYCHGCRFCWAL